MRRERGVLFQIVGAWERMAKLWGKTVGKTLQHLIIFVCSGLLGQLERYSHGPDGRPLCIYGDPAYPLRMHLQAPFRGAGLLPLQDQFNQSMSRTAHQHLHQNPGEDMNETSEEWPTFLHSHFHFWKWGQGVPRGENKWVHWNTSGTKCAPLHSLNVFTLYVSTITLLSLIT